MRIIIEHDERTGLAKVSIREPGDHGGETLVAFTTALVPTVEIKGKLQAEVCVPSDAHLSTTEWGERKLRSGVSVYRAAEVPADSDPI
jgi:hypothetical protein